MSLEPTRRVFFIKRVKRVSIEIARYNQSQAARICTIRYVYLYKSKRKKKPKNNLPKHNRSFFTLYYIYYKKECLINRKANQITLVVDPWFR